MRTFADPLLRGQRRVYLPTTPQDLEWPLNKLALESIKDEPFKAGPKIIDPLGGSVLGVF